MAKDMQHSPAAKVRSVLLLLKNFGGKGKINDNNAYLTFRPDLVYLETLTRFGETTVRAGVLAINFESKMVCAPYSRDFDPLNELCGVAFGVKTHTHTHIMSLSKNTPLSVPEWWWRVGGGGERTFIEARLPSASHATQCRCNNNKRFRPQILPNVLVLLVDLFIYRKPNPFGARPPPGFLIYPLSLIHLRCARQAAFPKFMVL